MKATPSHSHEAGSWGPAAILALMMLVAPAVGATSEEMLQDTLKSTIVSFSALLAALLFFVEQRRRSQPLRWHPGVWLPLLLAAYALGGMVWSHTYLAGVEAIRWFVFGLLMWLALNCLSRERLPLLAWGVAGGAAVASLWVALQFFANFSLFPQGPHPASTFVNRNFFAEFAICALPFVALLWARARHGATVALLSALLGLVILAIGMTGTRAALLALWLQLLLFPLVGWRWRAQLAWRGWSIGTRAVALAILVGVVGGLGSIPTADAGLAAEGKGVTALERAFKRTASIGPSDSSFSIRMVMWKATGRMIAAHPLAGVGAGAWENEIPLYQADNAQLETDFYVHNEFLQLIAEYGLAGWLFLIGLVAWLLAAARRTWLARDGQELEEAPWRAMLLSSLLALTIVSNVGFAWRLACTGAIFALCLGALAASDARIARNAHWSVARRFAWRPAYSALSIAVVTGALVLATYITEQAARSERKIVGAARIALTIGNSRDPNSPGWDRAKAEMLALMREGIAINRHYRKITPIVADELARWGDWKDAIWIWESVLSSRPHIVAILTNVARGYLATGDPAKAAQYLERAKQVQPGARSVRSAEVLLLSSTGRTDEALQLGRQAIEDGIYDFDLSNAVFVNAARVHEFALAEKAMQLRMNSWPATRVQGYMQLGAMYWHEAGDPAKALAAYGRALELVGEAERKKLWPEIPEALRDKLDPAPAPVGAQTSATKG